VRPDAQVTLLEKENRLAGQQTGRNSGVVHAGLYYLPGWLKATLCRRGVGLIQEFCAEQGIAYQEIGKVLVALDAEEERRLDGILERAAPTASRVCGCSAGPSSGRSSHTWPGSPACTRRAGRSSTTST
jgi:L-2-hydroxyglutarate oxidase LhgO